MTIYIVTTIGVMTKCTIWIVHNIVPIFNVMTIYNAILI